MPNVLSMFMAVEQLWSWSWSYKFGLVHITEAYKTALTHWLEKASVKGFMQCAHHTNKI